MRPHPLLQQGCQFGLHEIVVVGDVEADDPLALQAPPEAALEFGAVGALHDEDEVGLVEVVGRDRLLRIGRQAGGGGLDAGAAGEDPLGRGGAEAVAGAEEEEVGGDYCTSPSLSNTCRTSSKAALMFPLGNRI